MKKSKDVVILSVSNQLFLREGYKTATLRKIAQEAQVSLGLATYFFKTKRQIAVKILETYLRDLKSRVGEFVDPVQEPLLHSAVMVRLCDVFFMTSEYRTFFLECLYYDIYMESVQLLGNNSLQQITHRYHIEENPDIILLSDNYIPPSIERILLMEKEKGNFPNISCDDIPDIVFSASVERYVDHDQIVQATKQARIIVPQILANIPESQEYHQMLFPV